MNNSVFGKTMEDVRKRVNIDLVRQVGEERRLRRLISDPAFVSRKIFYGANLVAVHRRQTNVKLNKPEYVGACILDLSKYYMYDFWYGYLKRKYGDRVKLLYTDTDSLIIEIETENIYQDMIDDCIIGNLPSMSHNLPGRTNSNIMGVISRSSLFNSVVFNSL